MSARLYLKVLGDMAEYLGMFDQNYMVEKPEHQATMDGAELHCLYVCQDLPGGCQANCAYCTQGNDSRYGHKESYLINKFMVKYPMKRLISLIQDGFLEKKGIKRICLSGLHHPAALENAVEIFRMIRAASSVSITCCYTPQTREAFALLKEAGADRISINYEVATEPLFERFRGTGRKGSPYDWKKLNEAVDTALKVFGPNNVGTHLLIGLGETQSEALRLIQDLYDRRVDVSLFAFRPVKDTDLAEHPAVSHRYYHAVQLGRFIMLRRMARYEDMKFDAEGRIEGYGIAPDAVASLVASGKPFRNGGGCPNCNRVYYETNPSERYFNYPRDLKADEIKRIRQELFG